MESLNLSDLLQTKPELILDDTFLKFLLQNLTFRQFIAEVIAYPDIYTILSDKQQFWAQYFQNISPDKYYQLKKKENIKLMTLLLLQLLTL